VEVGTQHTMILRSDGTLWATGYNSSGQLGDGTTQDKVLPVLVMSGVASVSAGREHTVILKTDGTVWATGNNNYGQLGNKVIISTTTPVRIAP
jgi:alpha-tubulin suppressor-like RCC1 family protein